MVGAPTRLLAALAAAALAFPGFGQPVGQTHFFLQEGHHKCFLEDAASGVPLTVTYMNHDNPGIPCAVLVKDARGRTVSSRPVSQASPAGKLSYLVKDPGEHQVCVACESAQWFATSQLKWSVSVDMGDTDLDFEKVAKGRDMEAVREAVRSMQSQLTVLSAENDYERLQEVAFREAMESLKFRIIVLAVTSIAIVLGTQAAVGYTLRQYFRAQKLY